MSAPTSPPRPRLSRAEREQVVLDTAARLFYARGVHEVGMDELVRETGLAKPTVYRLYPSKDALVGAWLERDARTILGLIDADHERLGARGALHALVDAVAADVGRTSFRGCRFNNASIEFDDPGHPARRAAADYRRALRDRIRLLAAELLTPAAARVLADRLAVVVDGVYTNAAHLGPNGPAAAGLRLAHELVDAVQGRRARIR